MAGYVAAVQTAVGCITGEVVRATGHRPAPSPSTLLLAGGRAAVLTGGVFALSLDVRQFYRLVEDPGASRRHRWRVEVVGYRYAFVVRRTEQELLAFHWHPDVIEKSFPHVHLESGLGLHRDLVGIHVPTGEIALEDVIRFAIEDLGVRPRLARWRSVLVRTRARYAGPDE